MSLFISIHFSLIFDLSDYLWFLPTCFFLNVCNSAFSQFCFLVSPSILFMGFSSFAHVLIGFQLLSSSFCLLTLYALYGLSHSGPLFHFCLELSFTIPPSTLKFICLMFLSHNGILSIQPFQARNGQSMQTSLSLSFTLSSRPKNRFFFLNFTQIIPFLS